LPIGTPKIFHLSIYPSINPSIKEKEKEMTKPIKALGMALCAAMAALLLVATWWPSKRNDGTPRGEYAEFGECPLAAATIADCVYSVTSRCSCKWAEVVYSIETALREVRVAINPIQIPFPDLELRLERHSNKPFTRGTNRYIGSSRKYSVFRGELTVSIASGDSKISSEIDVDNANSTNSFYEQSQLKDCLA
jgi:hypothetical protein